MSASVTAFTSTSFATHATIPGVSSGSGDSDGSGVSDSCEASLASSDGGAVVDAGRTGRHAYDLTEGQRRHEQLGFVGEIVKLLERAEQQGDFGSFILVAPPKTLGEIRKNLTPALQKILSASIAKDLMKYDQRRLSEALPDLLESVQ